MNSRTGLGGALGVEYVHDYGRQAYGGFERRIGCSGVKGTGDAHIRSQRASVIKGGCTHWGRIIRRLGLNSSAMNMR